jgi:hypothetical protein
MLALREKVAELLMALPSTDPHALHALGDQLDRDRGLLDVFVGAIRDWLSARLDVEARSRSTLFGTIGRGSILPCGCRRQWLPG